MKIKSLKDSVVWLGSGILVGIGISFIVYGINVATPTTHLRDRLDAVSKFAGAKWAEADFAKGTHTVPSDWMSTIDGQDKRLDERIIILEAYIKTKKHLHDEQNFLTP